MSLPRDWRRAPSSTYRLQLSRQFSFEDAERIVPYLARLGIGACYTSPVLAARPGSTHGYDIVDHSQLNPELGGEGAFVKFAAALRASDLALVIDVVPNHMAADADANAWWRDVLENGQCSMHAEAFDIDWAPLKADLHGKLLLPILGEHYGAVLERGELRVSYANGAFVLDYFDQRLPLNPGPSARILRLDLDALREAMSADPENWQELLSIITGLDHLPPFTSAAPDQIEERAREKEILRRRLGALYDRSFLVRKHIDSALLVLNGRPGDPGSFDLLHELLEAQPYRLAYWRVAGHEINYRRFFDINGLAAIRNERPEVYETSHRLISRLVADGMIQGIRVDHPDGLYDPAEYFERLSRLDGAGRVPYIIVEKILAAGERLVASWCVDGTTGYDFLNDVGGVFVDGSAALRMRRMYARISGRRERLADVIYRSKCVIMDSSLASELNVLADALDRLSETSRRTRDFTLNSLRALLAATVAAFPLYRTYITGAGASESDMDAIDRALTDAERRNPTMEASSFRFLRDVLLPSGPRTERSLAFTMKLQQFTAPVQAKGLEDTAFYRHNVLISLNEVGGDPARFGRPIAEFHTANERRALDWPLGMLATSTHDTKLGEDARVRIHALAELSDEWQKRVSQWQRVASSSRRLVSGDWAPDGNDLYRLYQTLVGCWPAERDAGPPSAARLRAYMIKALREAKLHTSWLNEDSQYEAAVGQCIQRLLSDSHATSRRFLKTFEPFAQRVSGLGAVYSLGQLILKLASPGVPDFYQGSELWTLTLVDPDNRERIDFDSRARALADLEPLLANIEDRNAISRRPNVAEEVKALSNRWRDGHIKLFVTAAGLRLRRGQPDLFLAGDYQALTADLTTSAGVIAFARAFENRVVIAVASRLVGRASASAAPDASIDWGQSRLCLPAIATDVQLIDVLTGERHMPEVDESRRSVLSLSRVFSSLPVALLWAEVGEDATRSLPSRASPPAPL